MPLPDVPYLSIPDLVLRWQRWGATPAIIWECLKTDLLHIGQLPDGSHVYKQGTRGDFCFHRKIEGSTLGVSLPYEKLTGNENLLEVWVRTDTPHRAKAKSDDDRCTYKTFSSFINIEAIKRFETDHLSGKGTIEEKRKQQEEEIQLVELLKSEGLCDEEIAQTLKRQFPSISPFRIGVLLPANPGTTLEKNSIRKRGERLLKGKTRN